VPARTLVTTARLLDSIITTPGNQYRKR
jgi:hypothetical protein